MANTVCVCVLPGVGRAAITPAGVISLENFHGSFKKKKRERKKETLPHCPQSATLLFVSVHRQFAKTLCDAHPRVAPQGLIVAVEFSVWELIDWLVNPEVMQGGAGHGRIWWVGEDSGCDGLEGCD